MYCICIRYKGMFFFNDFVGSIIIKFQLDTVKYDKCLNAEALFFFPSSETRISIHNTLR